MWKYQQPDFASFLLAELQKQQQGTVFCDTLLQTEGVCVPAHGCVLAALSPIFSRVLSTSPAPPEGKNRLLSLEAVGSHALLKLVGFLYTGEMETGSQREHEEVMAAAHRLGLGNIIEKKSVWVEHGARDVGRCWKEAGVQTEERVRGKEGVSLNFEPLESRTYCNADNNDAPLTSVLEADWSCVEASPIRAFNCSDVTVASLIDMNEASVSNQHKTKVTKRWKMRDGQLKDPAWQQNHMKLLQFEGTKTGVTEGSANVSGKDFRKLLEAVSLQSSTAEHKETILDQLKVKIKLRRKGTCWKSNLLVSVQGESESDEVQECGPPTPGCLSGVLPGQNLGTLTPPTDLPISPSDSSTHLHAPTPNDSSVSPLLDLPTLSSSLAQADESDEHIAMLLEDMVMMGLNIVPLMPLDRNLDEHQLNHFDCEPKIGESDFSETSALSPQQRDEELEQSGFQNQSRPETIEPSALHVSLSNLSKDENLETMGRAASVAEDIWLTPKAIPDQPLSETGDTIDYYKTPIPDDRLDFKLLRCLSPLDSENADSDLPTQESSGPPRDGVSETHEQHPETQNLPLWLSASPLELDFTLSSVNSSSLPHSWLYSNCSQDQSCHDPAEKQELKTSFLHLDTITHSNMDQADITSEHLKQKMTKTYLAKCQNLANESHPNSELSTLVNANRKTVAGVKRRKEDSLSFSKKMSVNTTSKQNECEEDLPKEKVLVGSSKRGRGRPSKSKKRPAVSLHRCNNAQKLDSPPACLSVPSCLGQDDCKVKNGKTVSGFEADNKPGEPKEPGGQGKDSGEMGDADVNGNFEQIKQNIQLKYPGPAKATSIIDYIFHQTCPSSACQTPLLIGRQVTNLQGTSFPPQRFRRVFGKSGDCSKLVNNNEQSSNGICGENETEISVLMNGEKVEALDNHVSLQVSHSNMPETAEHSVKEGSRPASEENLEAAVVIQCDFQAEMGKNIQEQPAEISVYPLTSKDITANIMMPADDVMPITKTDSAVIPNKPTVMEKIDLTDMPTSLCITPDGTAAGGCKVVQPIKESFEVEETEVQRKNDEAVEEIALFDSDVGCQETPSGWDSDDIDVEGDQCSSEIDKRTLLDVEELSTAHIADAKIVDDLSSAALTPRDIQVISRNASSVQTDEVPHQSNSPGEDSKEVSKDDCHSDEEAIEVDVVEDPAETPLWSLSARQIIPLPTDGLQDQEVEMDVTEEEEVDVTGEETD